MGKTKVKLNLNNNNKGVTLTSLIITVILLIILASTSIGVVLNSNQIKKAKQSSNVVNEKTEKEEEKLSNTLSQWEEMQLSNQTVFINSAMLKGKSSNSINITAKAYSDLSDKVTYKLYISSDEYGVFECVAEQANISNHVEVELIAQDLSAGTTYWWYVKVSDGNMSVNTEIQSIKL